MRHHLTLLALLLLIALGAALTRYSDVRVDVSAGQRLSLNPLSLAILERLDGPVEVVCYIRENETLRPMIAEFIGRYRQHKPDLTLRFVNPDDDPADTRAREISIEGELELRYGSRQERLTTLQEQAFTKALARLSRSGDRYVLYFSGHGERRLDGAANADLGSFTAQLEAQGLRVLALNPLEQPEIPRNTGVLVLAGPRIPLSDNAQRTLLRYLERGGSLLWLTEPGSDDGLDSLAAALGVVRLPGTLVDGASQQYGIGDPSFTPVTRYGAHPITAGFDLVTLFPQALALASITDEQWTAVSLLSSGPQSWTETGPIHGDIAFDADAGELRGPLDLGLALTRERPDGAEQRVVVIGDGDFLSNSFLGNGGNRELGLRIFNWLLADDEHIDIAPISAPDARIDLSERALAVLGLGWLVLVPLLMLLGGLLWTWRRRRA